jgi:hypothetical protein
MLPACVEPFFGSASGGAILPSRPVRWLAAPVKGGPSWGGMAAPAPCSCRLKAVCVETGHAQRFTRPVNTDRNDARGIAEMKRIGHYRPVHVKSVEAQLIRATLQARRQTLAFRVTVDDPAHFDSSKAVGAHIGLTPRVYQSGKSMGQGRSVGRPITYSAICSMRRHRR